MNISAFWFRRDLRIEDNHGLYQALISGNPVLCFFVFDKNILDELERPHDKRVHFIYEYIKLIKERLISMGSDLIVSYDTPIMAWKKWIDIYPIQSVYANQDYEPYAISRDNQITSLLKGKSISFFCKYKDHVVFEAEEVKKNDGSAYSIYTHYRNKWFEKFQNLGRGHCLIEYPCEKHFSNFYKLSSQVLIPLEGMNFQKCLFPIPFPNLNEKIIKLYHDNREFPYIKGTTRLGIHLRFGTISVRSVLRSSINISSVFVNEIIWREFYSMILQTYPEITTKSFKPKYDNIEWLNNINLFQKWCEGSTGYPLVDAGMRELNNTGYMHNRVRMITASFLCKHLLIDWRWGESYFAKKLLDFDLASNNGGWQWSAGCGTDAAPYFRIFNPIAQQAKFDPEFKYISLNIEEWGTPSYPSPIVDHQTARMNCLNTYKKALSI